MKKDYPKTHEVPTKYVKILKLPSNTVKIGRNYINSKIGSKKGRRLFWTISPIEKGRNWGAVLGLLVDKKAPKRHAILSEWYNRLYKTEPKAKEAIDWLFDYLHIISDKY